MSEPVSYSTVHNPNIETENPAGKEFLIIIIIIIIIIIVIIIVIIMIATETVSEPGPDYGSS